MKTKSLLSLSEFAKRCIIANEYNIRMCKYENEKLQQRIKENLEYIERCKSENRAMKNRI